MRIIVKLSAIALSGALLSGCAAALIGGGVAGGYVASKNDKEISQYSGDSWITSKIKSKYVAESGLRSMNISVSTNNAVVNLTGSVKSEEQKAIAVQLAQETKGVKRVDASNLVIGK